jgi:hypothetical protein
VKNAIGRIVENIPVDADCPCRHALEGARF